jgi:hypothetical protein
MASVHLTVKDAKNDVGQLSINYRIVTALLALLSYYVTFVYSRRMVGEGLRGFPETVWKLTIRLFPG